MLKLYALFMRCCWHLNVIPLQLQHQDILSHQHVCDALAERVGTLGGQSPTDAVAASRINRQLADLTATYKQLCDDSKVKTDGEID